MSNNRYELKKLYLGMSNKEIMEIYWAADDPELRKDLSEVVCTKNEKLIFKLLHGYSDGVNPSDIDDYVQSAKEMIIEKLPQYTPEKAAKMELSTFLRRYIIMGFSNASSLGDGTTKHEHNMLVKLNKVRKKFEAEKRDYTELDICEELSIGIDAYNAILSNEKKLKGGVRLDDPTSASFIAQAAEDPEDIAIREERKENVRKALSNIVSTESNGKMIAQVIVLSFGLDGEKVRTTGDIAKRLNMTNADVRRLKNRGLSLLKNSSALRGYGYKQSSISCIDEYAGSIRVDFFKPSASLAFMEEAAKAEREGIEAIPSDEFHGDIIFK